MNLITCFSVGWLVAVPSFMSAQARLDERHLKAINMTVSFQHKNAKVALDFPAQPLCFVPVFSPSDLPFFCKIEHQWAKKLPVPVKFRLGSVPYVDWLEGKNDLPDH